MKKSLFAVIASLSLLISGVGANPANAVEPLLPELPASASDKEWWDVTFGNGLFVAVGGATSGSGNRVMTSPDGITWTSRTSAANNSWFSVIYGNGLFVAVARFCSSNCVMTSPDGITWTSANAGVAIERIEYVTFTDNGSMWVGTYGSNGWARSLNTPPSSFSTGTSGSSSMGAAISYNSNTLIATNNFGRFSRATETTSFNTVWNPVTGVSA